MDGYDRTSHFMLHNKNVIFTWQRVILSDLSCAYINAAGLRCEVKEPYQPVLSGTHLSEESERLLHMLMRGAAVDGGSHKDDADSVIRTMLIAETSNGTDDNAIPPCWSSAVTIIPRPPAEKEMKKKKAVLRS